MLTAQNLTLGPICIGLSLSLSIFGGGCESDAECYSTPPTSASSVTINGVTWPDDTSVGSNAENMFVSIRDPNSSDQLDVTIQRGSIGSHDLLAVASEFGLFFEGVYYSQLQSGQLTITASESGTGELCNGKFNFEFSFAVAGDNTELITGAGQSDSKNLPGPGGGGGGGGGGGSGGLASCTDSAGVCSQLNSGNVSSFQGECEGAGNSFSMSACPAGAYSCTGGMGTSSGSSVAIDIHWPSGICNRPEYQDMIYLKGTCENVLGGSYGGDASSCCSGTTSPSPGGTSCQ